MTDVTNQTETETETNRANPNGTFVLVGFHAEAAIYLDPASGVFFAEADGKLLSHSSLETVRGAIDKVWTGRKLVRKALKVPVRVFVKGEVKVATYTGVHTKGDRSHNAWVLDGNEWISPGHRKTLVPQGTSEALLARAVEAFARHADAERELVLATAALGLESVPEDYAGYNLSVAERIERQNKVAERLAPYAPPAGAASEGGAL